MTARAVILGLAIGVGVAAVTYLNDVVARQAQLIGHFFPLGVVGALLVVALGVNPLLARLGLAMRPGELAVAAAIAFAACGWPGAGFYRGAPAVVAMPRHWERAEPAWRAQEVLAYVPRGRPAVAEGHVSDWPRLIEALREPPSPAARAVAEAMTPAARERVARLGGVGFVEPADRSLLLRELNRVIEAEGAGAAGSDGAWRARERLAEAFPGTVLPPPSGAAVLVPGDRHEALAGYVAGGDGGVPWSLWRGVAGFWAPVALAMAACAFCLSLIVHPQWTRHELLAYPIPRFVDAITGGDADAGGGAPLLRSRGFWVAAACAAGVHLLNGLQGWFNGLPRIPLRLDLSGLHTLFPQASRLHELTAYTRPTILLSAIGFAYFLSGTVSLSLGVSQLLYVFLASALLARGVTLGGVYGEPSDGGLLRFGAYAAFAAMIVYLGRRFYGSVCREAVGLKATTATPRYAVWAARGLAVATALSVALLVRGGLGWLPAALLVAMVLLTVLVLSRVVAETGAFFLQPSWLPFTVVAPLVGVEALGPTGFVLLALGSIVLVGDPRETLMPFLVNAWRIADRPGGASPRRAAPAVAVMVVGSFVVAGVATLWVQHRWGMIGADRWTNRLLPSVPFDVLSRQTASMSAQGTLAEATAAGAGVAPGLVELSGAAWGWVGLGVALVLVTAAARLRLPGWPLHPVVFVVWGTWPMTVLAASFLLGCGVKAAVTRLGGAAGYRRGVPVMIGLVAGELFGALVWAAVGLGAFLVTGQSPPRYALF